MRKSVATLMTVAMLGATGATFAAQEKAAPAPAAKSAAQRVHTIKGTVKTYDSATNTLTVSTAKGTEERFMLEPKATLREGEKAIAVSDLSQLTGREATVRYMESDGQKHAESVMVSTAAPTKPSGTSGTKETKPAGEAGKKY
jgi:hypothetical protein